MPSRRRSAKQQGGSSAPKRPKIFTRACRQALIDNWNTFYEKAVIDRCENMKVPATVLNNPYVQRALEQELESGFREKVMEQVALDGDGNLDMTLMPDSLHRPIYLAFLFDNNRPGEVKALNKRLKKKFKHLRQFTARLARACPVYPPVLEPDFNEGCQPVPEEIKAALDPVVDLVRHELTDKIAAFALDRRERFKQYEGVTGQSWKNVVFRQEIFEVESLGGRVVIGHLNETCADRFAVMPGPIWFEQLILHAYLRGKGMEAVVRTLLCLEDDAVVDHYIADCGLIWTVAKNMAMHPQHRDGPDGGLDDPLEVQVIIYLQPMDGAGGHFFTCMGAGQSDTTGTINLVGKYGVLLLSKGQPKWGYSVFDGWLVHGVMPNVSDTPRLAIYITYHKMAAKGQSPMQTDHFVSNKDWDVAEAGPYPGEKDSRKTYFHFFLRKLYKEGRLDHVSGIDAAVATMSQKLVAARLSERAGLYRLSHAP